MTGASTRWGAVWVVFLAGLVSAGAIGKVPPLLPTLREDLSLTLLQSGLIATMLNVMGALVGVFAGVFSDRLGPRRFAVTGLLVMAVGCVSGALANGYPLLLLSRFLEGAGFIMTTVSGVALIANVSQLRDRPRAMALWSSYMPTGGALAMLAAPIALAGIGWRGYWLALAGAAIVSAILLLREVPAPPSGGGTRPLQLALESLLSPGALALCLAFTGYAAMWAAVMIWLPTFAVEQRGYSHAVGGLLAAAMVAINIPGNLMGGWLMARGVGRSSMILLASGIQAVAACGALLDLLPDTLRFACVLAFSFFGGPIPMAVMSGIAVHARTPGHIGTTSGMVMQASQVAQFFGPLCVAWVAGLAGWGATLGPMLAFAACSLAGGWMIGRIESSFQRSNRHA